MDKKTLLTNYQFWQLEKKGNILQEPQVMPSGECEAGEEEMKRSEEWTHSQHEQTLFEYENQYR